jgi:phenylalanyl-tRNA synthetase beta chain
MAVIINTTLQDVQKALGKKITVKELEETLFDMGFELVENEDKTLTIELTPERLDLLSLQGFARAIKCFKYGEKIKTNFKTKKNNYVVNVTKEVKNVRPYTVCAVIKNLKLDEDKLLQIIDLQEKLHNLLARGRVKGAIGVYPLDKIKMPITYTAADPKKIKFVPLGMSKIMNGHEILTEHEKGKEFAHLLEGKEKFPYFIDENNQILSMPPIINSENTGKVTTNTKDLFIECSGFDKLLLNEMLTNIVTMFDDMDADIYDVEVKYENEKSEILPKLNPIEMIIQRKTISQLLGLNLDDEKLKELLSKMMYQVKSITKTEIQVLAPCYRRDLWHEIDVADDIARAYGYNNFKLVVPKISTFGETLPISDLKEELSQFMVGFGFLETYTYTLVSKKDHTEKMLQDKIKFIPVINGTENQTMMRVSIIPELLNSLSNNRHNPLPQNIFEVGLTIIPDDKKDVLCKNQMNLTSMIADKVVSFTQIKQILDALLKSKGLICEIMPISHSSFIDGRCGQVIVNGNEIGIIGEIHPQVLVNFGLITPVACFEINIEKLL